MTTFEVERVLSALERLVGTLAKADADQAASLPDDAVGLIALVSILPAAVSDLDTGVRQTSPRLQNVLTASGYGGSVNGFWQWYTDTERVLLAYEILDRNLSYERISSERDLDILNSALIDADAVRPYKTRLDEFAQRLTGSDR